jgi:hypothetical protein
MPGPSPDADAIGARRWDTTSSRSVESPDRGLPRQERGRIRSPGVRASQGFRPPPRVRRTVEECSFPIITGATATGPPRRCPLTVPSSPVWLSPLRHRCSPGTAARLDVGRPHGRGRRPRARGTRCRCDRRAVDDRGSGRGRRRVLGRLRRVRPEPPRRVARSSGRSARRRVRRRRGVGLSGSGRRAAGSAGMRPGGHGSLGRSARGAHRRPRPAFGPAPEHGDAPRSTRTVVLAVVIPGYSGIAVRRGAYLLAVGSVYAGVGRCDVSP